MRFGISATSPIEPNCFRMRLRPLKVSAISAPSSFAGDGPRSDMRCVSRAARSPAGLLKRLTGRSRLRVRSTPKGPSGKTVSAARATRFREPAAESRLVRWRAATPLPRSCRSAPTTYFTSTTAPWSSSCFLSLAASSLVTPSLTVLPPASTRSLASFRPRPVMARTSLMTLIFLSPPDFRMTVNSVCSSTGAAAAPPAGSGDGDGSSSRHAPLLFEQLGEFGSFAGRSASRDRQRSL